MTAETLVQMFSVIRHEKDNNLITSSFSLKLTGGLFQIYRVYIYIELALVSLSD